MQSLKLETLTDLENRSGWRTEIEENKTYAYLKEFKDLFIEKLSENLKKNLTDWTLDMQDEEKITFIHDDISLSLSSLTNSNAGLFILSQNIDSFIINVERKEYFIPFYRIFLDIMAKNDFNDIEKQTLFYEIGLSFKGEENIEDSIEWVKTHSVFSNCKRKFIPQEATSLSKSDIFFTAKNEFIDNVIVNITNEYLLWESNIKL